MLKIGQRVKKVRGTYNIGRTGIVVGKTTQQIGDRVPFPLSPTGFGIVSEASDIQVCIDQPCCNSDGIEFPAGTTLYSQENNWEPIVDDGAQPSRYTYEELMDKFTITNPDESRELVLVEVER